MDLFALPTYFRAINAESVSEKVRLSVSPTGSCFSFYHRISKSKQALQNLCKHLPSGEGSKLSDFKWEMCLRGMSPRAPFRCQISRINRFYNKSLPALGDCGCLTGFCSQIGDYPPKPWACHSLTFNWIKHQISSVHQKLI